MTFPSRTVVAAAAALALTAALVSAVAAHADDEPDPSRIAGGPIPAATDPAAAPDPTASPDATAAPDATASPDPAASPDATASPDPTASPDAAATPAPAGPDADSEPEPAAPAPANPGSFALAPGDAPHQALVIAGASANSFAGAVTLTGWQPDAQFDSRAATVESKEPRAVLGGHTISRTMWAKWIAPANGVVTVSAEGGSSAANPAINAYVGSSISKLTRVGSNDQQYPVVGMSGDPWNGARILSLKVRKGVLYRFQVGTSTFPAYPNVDGFASMRLAISGGTFDLPNDALADAQPLTLGADANTTVTTFLSGARVESWEPYDNPGNPDRPRLGSVWYSWTAPVDGTVVLATCTPARSTTIVAYASTYPYGSDGGDLSQVGFSEPNYSGYCGSQLGDRLQLVVKAGHLYRFQVSTLANVTEPALGETTLTMGAFFGGPWIAKVSPASGSSKGGTLVTLIGQNLVAGDYAVATVTFGGRVAPVVRTYPTTNMVTVKVPKAAKKGKVAVQATMLGRISNTVSYTYK